MMHGLEKSDFAVVAMKPANKAGVPAAERVERTAGTKGNADLPRTCRTQSRVSVSQGLERVRQADAWPSDTQGRSRMPESGTCGSVRGVPGNRHPYRDPQQLKLAPIEHEAFTGLCAFPPKLWRSAPENVSAYAIFIVFCELVIKKQ